MGPLYDRQTTLKCNFMFIGAIFGEIIAMLSPTFPLMAVVLLAIFFDVHSSYKLGKRVKAKYPDQTKKESDKFNSFAFRKVVTDTIPTRLWVIILIFVAEKYIFMPISSLFVTIDLPISCPLTYIVAGAIVGEQFLSILENLSSCREDKDGRIWQILRRVLIDKTSRHLDVNLDDLKETEREE